MPLIGRFNCLLLIAFCIACVLACAANPNPLAPTPQIVAVKIKLDERSMIIVPVSVNGAGPYDFVLDTGCTKTIVDRKLATELGLRLAAESTIVGVLASAKMSAVEIRSLSVGGASVQGGEVFSAEHGANVASRVRGVLGEDFLRNFDILIDYRHMVMWLEPAPGSLAGSAIGEHLPLQFTASDRGELARTQPVIYGRIPEMGDAPISLLLDSGANQLTLLRDTLGPGEYQAEPILTGSFSRWVTSTATARRIRSLDLGSTVLSNLIVVGLARRTGVNWDGVLPTSLFHSVLISHFGRFAILNPSFPKESGDVLAAR